MLVQNAPENPTARGDVGNATRAGPGQPASIGPTGPNGQGPTANSSVHQGVAVVGKDSAPVNLSAGFKGLQVPDGLSDCRPPEMPGYSYASPKSNVTGPFRGNHGRSPRERNPPGGAL